MNLPTTLSLAVLSGVFDPASGGVLFELTDPVTITLQ